MNNVTVAEQTGLFLMSIGFGFIIGILYDVFRIIRLTLFSHSISVFIQDIIYWVTVALLTFLFILNRTGGEIRAYIIFGEMLGWVIYYFTLGMVVMKLSKAITEFVKKLFRVITRPFVILFLKTHKLSQRIFGKMKKNSKKISNKTKFNLKTKRILLYNLIKVPKIKKTKKYKK